NSRAWRLFRSATFQYTFTGNFRARAVRNYPFRWTKFGKCRKRKSRRKSLIRAKYSRFGNLLRHAAYDAFAWRIRKKRNKRRVRQSKTSDPEIQPLTFRCRQIFHRLDEPFR